MIRIYSFLLLLLALGMAACASEPDKLPPMQTAGQNTLTPDGMAVFRQNCIICHGADGKLGLNGAKDLSKSERPLEERLQIITNGKNLMAPFHTILSPKEIQAVAEYTLTLKK